MTSQSSQAREHDPAIDLPARGAEGLAQGLQHRLGQQHRQGALEHIHHKDCERRALAHHPQHVGGAGGARTLLANIDPLEPAAREVAAGDGAE